MRATTVNLDSRGRSGSIPSAFAARSYLEEASFQILDALRAARVSTLKEGGARLDWVGERIAFDMPGPGDFFALYVMRADGR